MRVVKCVTPAALARENGILKASVILDVCTDVSRKIHVPEKL